MVPLLARPLRGRGRRLHVGEPCRRFRSLEFRREAAAAVARDLGRIPLPEGGALKAVQKRPFSRRALLSGLGASAALSPFLPLLEAEGQEAKPLRLILWFTPHGTVYDN